MVRANARAPPVPQLFFELCQMFAIRRRNSRAKPLNFPGRAASKTANGDSLSRSPPSLPGGYFRFPQAGIRCPVDSPDPLGNFFGCYPERSEG
jgi:hypothetical protein